MLLRQSGSTFCQFTGSEDRRHCVRLVGMKFVEKKMFAGANFRELVFHHVNSCLKKISRYTVCLRMERSLSSRAMLPPTAREVTASYWYFYGQLVTFMREAVGVWHITHVIEAAIYVMWFNKLPCNAGTIPSGSANYSQLDCLFSRYLQLCWVLWCTS